MPDKLVRQESAVQFFREQLVKAMEHQRISTSAFTEYYLVNLLTAFMRGEILPAREPSFDEVPLALLYLRALDASRWEPEVSRLAHPPSVVKLYERWIQTGSRRAAALLAAQGIAPVAPSEGPIH